MDLKNDARAVKKKRGGKKRKKVGIRFLDFGYLLCIRIQDRN